MKLIRFEAIWCPSCLVMKQRFNKVNTDDIEMVSYDYDNDTEMVEKYNIGTVLPVIVIVDNNEKEIKRFIGEQSVTKLEEILNICRERF